MNVIENISYCKTHNISGALLCIDQAKAFDSVSHNFLNEVYKFFGIGDKFIGMMATLGNSRVACLRFSDGTMSSNFPLEQGRAQGDSPSPAQYNMAQQILIFKLEFDPNIRSIVTGPHPLAGHLPFPSPLQI